MYHGLIEEVDRLCKGKDANFSYANPEDYLIKQRGCREITPLHTGIAGPVFRCNADKVYKFMPLRKPLNPVATSRVAVQSCDQHAMEYYIPHSIYANYGQSSNMVQAQSIERASINGTPFDILETQYIPQGDYMNGPSGTPIYILCPRKCLSTITHACSLPWPTCRMPAALCIATSSPTICSWTRMKCISEISASRASIKTKNGHPTCRMNYSATAYLGTHKYTPPFILESKHNSLHRHV